MAFLNPFVLFGLAAAAIPLIIHLFNFRKPKRIDFSSLTFVRELQRSTMRRVRIRQWILLFLRTAAIVCLVLAFARPTLQGPLAGLLGNRASTSVAIVLDNSLSMLQRDRNGLFLDQAVEAGKAVRQQLDSRDEVFLYEGTPSSEHLSGRELTGAEGFDDIEARASRSSLEQQLAAAADWLVESPLPNHELYFITDLQASTFPDSIRIRFPRDTRLFLLPTGTRTTENVAVTRVGVESQIIEAGQPVVISARIENFGDTQLTGGVANLTLEGERLAQAAVDIAPRSAIDVSFAVVPELRGRLGGTIGIEADGFPYDDLRHFVLHVPERRKVLLVYGQRQQRRYLELALSQQLEGGQSAFDLEIVPESALPATSLSTFDAVMLAGLSTGATGEGTRLASFVGEGGGILFFSAATADQDVLFAALGGGRTDGLVGDPGQFEPVARIEQGDLEHPLFQGIFDDAEQGARALERPNVYAYVSYLPGGGDERTIVSLSNGRPFVQEVRHGRGTSLLFMSAPEPSWTDLPVRGLFLPLLYRSLFYLTSGRESAGEGYMLGEPGAVRVSAEVAGNIFLVSPDGNEFALDQRALNNGVVARLPADLSEPGLYEVRGSAGNLLQRLAINLPAAESDLDKLSPDQAAARLERMAGIPVVLQAAGAETADISEFVREARFGVELWQPFLLAALLFLLAEMLVAMRWRPEVSPDQNG